MTADATSNKNYSKILHETISKKYKKRIILDKLVTIFTIVCVIAAIVPLASILLEVIKNGASAISFEFLTQPQGSIGSGSGGIGPAIQGLHHSCRTCIFNSSTDRSFGRYLPIRICQRRDFS